MNTKKARALTWLTIGLLNIDLRLLFTEMLINIFRGFFINFRSSTYEPTSII